VVFKVVAVCGDTISDMSNQTWDNSSVLLIVG